MKIQIIYLLCHEHELEQHLQLWAFCPLLPASIENYVNTRSLRSIVIYIDNVQFYEIKLLTHQRYKGWWMFRTVRKWIFKGIFWNWCYYLTELLFDQVFIFSMWKLSNLKIILLRMLSKSIYTDLPRIQRILLNIRVRVHFRRYLKTISKSTLANTFS